MSAFNTPSVAICSRVSTQQRQRPRERQHLYMYF